MMKQVLLKLALASTAALATAVPASATVRYTILDLGAMTPGVSIGRAINASGQVAGDSQTSFGKRHAFFYDGAHLTNLTLPETGNNSATGVNAGGTVVGIDFNTRQSWVYQGGAMHSLSGSAGQGVLARGINDAGAIAGLFDVPAAAKIHAFLYKDGTFTDLGGLGGESFGLAINNANQVVGMSYFSDPTPGVFQPFHATLYSGGTITDLDPHGVNSSQANSINDAGQITGEWQVPLNLSGTSRAFIYSGGVMTDLGILPGAEHSSTVGDHINNLGDVVGESGSKAFIYHGGQMTDLNTLIDPASGWQLIGAWANNDAGQITGIGTIGGLTHAFLLTPLGAAVPEPASWALMLGGLGLAGLALRRRERPALA